VRTLPISQRGETADVRNVRGFAMYLTPQALHFGGGGVDIVDCDMRRPEGFHPSVAYPLRHGHHAADLAFSGAEQRVGQVGDRHILHVPADHLAVERLGGGHIGAHELIPNEGSLRVRHKGLVVAAASR